MVTVNSTTPYEHYKFIVDTIKRPSDNIMQFADIKFFFDDTDPNSGFLAATDPIIAVDEVPIPPFSGWKPCGTPNTDCSSSPGGEQPPLAIDQVFNPGPTLLLHHEVPEFRRTEFGHHHHEFRGPGRREFYAVENGQRCSRA